MSELSGDARALLVAFRKAESPPVQVAEDGLTRFHAMIAAGAVPQIAAVGAAKGAVAGKTVVIAKSAGKLGLTIKGLLVGGAIGAVSVGGLVAVKRAQGPEQAKEQAAAVAQTTDSRKPPAKQQPRKSATPPPVAPVNEPGAEQIEPAKASTQVPAPAVAEPSGSVAKQQSVPVETAKPGLLDELKLLERARTSEGRARLQLLDEYDEHFPDGSLHNEILVLRAEALCALGERDRLAALIEGLERSGASSPRVRRIRGICPDAQR